MPTFNYLKQLVQNNEETGTAVVYFLTQKEVRNGENLHELTNVEYNPFMAYDNKEQDCLVIKATTIKLVTDNLIVEKLNP